MEVICLEAFFELGERVADQIENKRKSGKDKLIEGSEAMQMLVIKALSTLQNLRNEQIYQIQ